MKNDKYTMQLLPNMMSFKRKDFAALLSMYFNLKDDEENYLIRFKKSE